MGRHECYPNTKQAGPSQVPSELAAAMNATMNAAVVDYHLPDWLQHGTIQQIMVTE